MTMTLRTLNTIILVLCFIQVKGEGQCNLEDSTGTFFVDGTERKCLWAKRHHYSRCDLDVVKKNCPKTCEVPCPPDGIISPLPTNRPSAAVELCEDGKDLQATVFEVNGIERTCAWAKRLKDLRCDIDIVQEKCPLTCSIPCVPSSGEESSDEGDGDGDAPVVDIDSSDSSTGAVCEDGEDLRATVFEVDGIERTCLWAKRLKDLRCDIDIIQEKCPLTCNIPCVPPSSEESSDDADGDAPVVDRDRSAGANLTSDGLKSYPSILVVILSASVIAIFS